MKNRVITIASACLLTAGCAHPAFVSPVEITRFVGNAPMALGRGTIAIVPASGTDDATPAYAAYAEAVSAQLAMLGYDVVPGNAEQTAMLSVESFVAGEERGGSGIGVGVGGSTGRYGSGVGLGVGINLNSLAGRPPETIERRVSLAIRFPALGDTNPGANLWEGRAQMSATSNSDYAGESAAAARMVDALFTNFPGTSGETVVID